MQTPRFVPEELHYTEDVIKRVLNDRSTDAPSVLCSEVTADFGRKCILVTDAVRLIQDDSIPIADQQNWILPFELALHRTVSCNDNVNTF